MDRRKFIKLSSFAAFAVSATGFTLFEENGVFSTDCATSRDMLGPFFRRGAPQRSDLTYPGNTTEVPLQVIGQVFGADCTTPLPNVPINIWHCDHRRKYDMESEEYRCRGQISTDSNGAYAFNTCVPPPYGGRPKHIHYLIDEVEGYQQLVTQLYFKGDKKIRRNNWLKYPWDERRILEVYTNTMGVAEVRLDIFLTPKS